MSELQTHRTAPLHLGDRDGLPSFTQTVTVTAGDEQGERVDLYWLAGELGAASTWFSRVEAVLGHSVCDGRGLHSLQERPGATRMPCEWLPGGECWWTREEDAASIPGLSFVLGRHPVVVAHDAGDLEPMWEWLAAGYEQLRG